MHREIMPSDRRSRALGSLKGEGFVYNGDQQVAKVRFSLTVTEGEHGVIDIRGVMTILDGQRRLAEGSILVLQFSNGRHWEFSARSGNFITGEYLVVGTGRQDIFPG
jgi:hypothetical protein